MNTMLLKLRGMSCAACASNIEAAIRQVPGVDGCSVNFGAEQATVHYDPRKASVENIQAAVNAAGYAATPFQEQDLLSGEDDAEKLARLSETRLLQQKVLTGGIISAVLVIGSLPAMTGWHVAWIPAWLHNFELQALLTAPVQFWCGKSFYINAWKSLKRHAATMDTLIALGTSAAYFYSLFVMAFPDVLAAQGLAIGVYFETAAVVITLILLGRLFEQRARGQTSEAIRKLVGLQAKTARVIRAGKEHGMLPELPHGLHLYLSSSLSRKAKDFSHFCQTPALAVI